MTSSRSDTFCRLNKFQLLVHAHIAELGNIDAAHRDGEAGGLQALAVAGGALLAGHDKGDFLLDPPSLPVSRKRRSRLGIMPSNVFI